MCHKISANVWHERPPIVIPSVCRYLYRSNCNRILYRHTEKICFSSYIGNPKHVSEFPVRFPTYSILSFSFTLVNSEYIRLSDTFIGSIKSTNRGFINLQLEGEPDVRMRSQVPRDLLASAFRDLISLSVTPSVAVRRRVT